MQIYKQFPLAKCVLYHLISASNWHLSQRQITNIFFLFENWVILIIDSYPKNGCYVYNYVYLFKCLKMGA